MMPSSFRKENWQNAWNKGNEFVGALDAAGIASDDELGGNTPIIQMLYNWADWLVTVCESND